MVKIDLSKLVKDEYLSTKFGFKNLDEFRLLGHGEYNINYIFYSATMKADVVLRVATASQMHLKNQIEYEYKALELLGKNDRTPKVFYYDDTKKLIAYGFLFMEFLEGKALNYDEDLEIAAEILADIHNEDIGNSTELIEPEDPLGDIYKECLAMYGVYEKSIYKDKIIGEKIEELLTRVKKIKNVDIGRRTIINTELNSGNFLINGKDKKNYLIDWEKPLYGYPAQDLGHFLAPTTTFWKTDKILNREEIMDFLSKYVEYSKEYDSVEKLWETTKNYISINCLRGITWCSMAYVDYQSEDKLIVNQTTYEKIKAYLSEDFLDMIRDEFLDEYE